MQLRTLKAIDHDIAALDTSIEAQLEPFRAQHRLLIQIPGVDWATAAAILAEIGPDMSVFVTARRLAAWAGVAPGITRAPASRRELPCAGATCS
jgi:transposase